ncbi:hypothetical protein [Phytoactinopolyspora mesophila]|uniref:Copper chaperone PCu(A)C n=1 Tax=Phytoactinopolyspora mesophila TaxID=2650750 RepID=A0A7K3M5C2_9ACTN|nr:hypothetical protein [Phytoactinopolyspora mesophila]NDL58142.1 hypothetical protein [Phytoactinopolyspora mesophila]
MKPAVRRCVLVSIPTLAFVLAGCNVQDKSQWWDPRYDGVPAEAGDIGLRNVVVVTSADGRATLLTSFANRGSDDELLEVRVAGSSATPPDGPLEIPARGYAALEPSATQIEFTDVEITPGLLTEVEYHFAEAPRVTVEALVKEAEGRYAHVTFAESSASDDDTALDVAEDEDPEDADADDEDPADTDEDIEDDEE